MKTNRQNKIKAFSVAEGFIVLVLSLYIFSACSKIVPFDPTPSIEHISIDFQTQLVEEQQIAIFPTPDTIKQVHIAFNLIDGDADIGTTNYTKKDTSQTGIHLWLYIPNSEGKASPIQDTILEYTYFQFPELEQYKTSGQIVAQIDVDIDSYYTSLFPYDTIAYRYYVVDKSGNKSNELMTSLTVLEPLK